MRFLSSLIFVFNIFITLIFLPFSVKSQVSNTVTIKDVFTTSHQFEFTLSHGFVRGEITPISGQHKAYPITGRVFDGAFGYTYNLSQRFGISGAGKLGAYPTILGIPETNYTPGSEYNSYFDYVFYDPFAELTAKLSFRQFISKNLALSTSAGYGSKYFFSAHSHFSTSREGSNGESSYETFTSGGAKPFFLLQSSLLYKLKNSDLIGLNVSYQHSFRNIQTGNYKIATNTPEYSYGDFLLKGHQFTIGLSYIFSGYEKYKSREAAGTDKSRKEIKKQYNREYYSKRMGNNTAVRVYGAVFADQNTSTDPHDVIISSRPLSLGAGIDFIYGYNSHSFLEAGANFHEYYNGLGINNHYVLSGSSVNAFNVLQISAGTGYIIRNKNLVPVLCLSGGAALVFNTDGDRTGPVSSSNMTMDHPGSPMYLDIKSEEYLRKTVFPLLYAGIRKDIRIRGRLFFSPEFKYYQGLMKIFESQIKYTTNEIRPEYRNTSIFMRGSYFQYGIGLKFDL